MRAPRRPAIAVLAALLALIGATCRPAAEARPDVVLIVIDTLRADRLGCYGYPRPTSPEIDRLAREGRVFLDCTAQAPWTKPSMSSMLTGRYYAAHRDYPVPGHFLLSQAFQQAGYTTIGASANALLSKEMLWDRGFDFYDAAPGDPADPEQIAGRHFEILLRAVEEPLRRALQPREGGTRKPLYLYLQPIDPHEPYTHHPELDDVLPLEGTEPVRPDGWQAREVNARGKPAPEGDPGWANDLAEIHRLRGRYDQEVRHTDDVLAGFLRRLREMGLAEDTVIAIVSDHGEGLWEHVNVATPEKLATYGPNGFFFQGHSHHLYEEAIRTPFILWGPRVPKGGAIEQPVENVDLFPTLCALARIEPPTGLDGRNLLDLLAGRVEGWRGSTYSFAAQSAAVREDASGLKLIVPTCFGRKNTTVVPELFDLRRDADEREDLHAARPAEAQALLMRLDGMVRAHEVHSTLGEKKTREELDRMAQMGYVEVAGDGSSHVTGCDG